MQNFFIAALLSTAVSGLTIRADNSHGTNTCGATKFPKYTVVEGDTLTTIADAKGSGICNIASYNNIANPNLIDVGQKLRIPICVTEPDNTSCIKSTPPGNFTCVPGVGSTYVVISGDTFTIIANAFALTLEALEAANPQVPNYDVISIGQVLHVPICPDSHCTIGTYIIQSGDTFYDLAMEYGTTTGQIQSVNQGVVPTQLEVGQTIVLPKDCVPARG